MQANVVTKKVFTVSFTEEEYKLFVRGIGNTSSTSREKAGMSVDQAMFFSDLYSALPDTEYYYSGSDS